MNREFLYYSFVLTILLSFFLGSYLLENLGVQYVSEGGSFAFKLHFYTYVIISCFFLHCLVCGRDKFIERLGGINSYWWCSFFAIILVIVLSVVMRGFSGVAYLVDSILVPILSIPLLIALSCDQKSRLVTLTGYLILFNSLLALLEYGVGRTLTNVEFLGFTHFRSTALLSHPLNNALITAVLAPLLLSKTMIHSFIYFSIVLLSLFAYGGRVAVAVFLLSMFILSLKSIGRFIKEGVVVDRKTFAILQFLVVFVFLALLGVGFLTEIGDRITSKLYLDNSARARMDVFNIFDYMAINEWFLGASESLRQNLEYITGIRIIENYLVGWIFTYGIVGTFFLLVSVFGLLIYSMKFGLVARLSIFSFVMISISNNSLMTKTPVLLFLFTVLFCLYDKPKSTGCHRNTLVR